MAEGDEAPTECTPEWKSGSPPITIKMKITRLASETPEAFAVRCKTEIDAMKAQFPPNS